MYYNLKGDERIQKSLIIVREKSALFVFYFSTYIEHMQQMARFDKTTTYMLSVYELVMLIYCSISIYLCFSYGPSDVYTSTIYQQRWRNVDRDTYRVCISWAIPIVQRYLHSRHLMLSLTLAVLQG